MILVRARRTSTESHTEEVEKKTNKKREEIPAHAATPTYLSSPPSPKKRSTLDGEQRQKKDKKESVRGSAGPGTHYCHPTTGSLRHSWNTKKERQRDTHTHTDIHAHAHTRSAEIKKRADARTATQENDNEEQETTRHRRKTEPNAGARVSMFVRLLRPCSSRRPVGCHSTSRLLFCCRSGAALRILCDGARPVLLFLAARALPDAAPSGSA